MEETKNDFDVSDDIDPDKTGEKNETPPEEKDEKEKVDKSEIAQKRHWREKYDKAQERISELESEKQKSQPKQESGDEREQAAQRYIREQARKAYEDIIAEKELKEQKVIEAFNAKIESLLEDNPDISEDDILGVIEKYKVEPDIAVKILLDKGTKIEKPKMPSAKRGSPSPEKDKTDDKGKTLYQIAREAAKEFITQNK